jgi:hypothetical protein
MAEDEGRRRGRLSWRGQPRWRGWRDTGGEARAFAVVCVGSLVLSGWSIWRSRFKIGDHTAFVLYDDAMISMRYARNLADGHGLVWNAGGERVEGITNPLWAMWMAVLHLVPVGPFKQSLLVMLSSAAVLLVVLWIARRLAHEVAPGDTTVAVAATVMTATFSPLVLWAMGGMEVGVLAWLLGAALLSAVRLVRRPEAWERRDTIVLTVLAVAAIATRVDAVVGLGAVAAAAVWCARPDQRRRTALTLGGPVVGGLALVTAVRLAYYGELLPNTYYLKATGVGLDVRLDAGFRHLVVALWAHLAILTIAAVIGAPALRSARRSAGEGEGSEAASEGDDVSSSEAPVPASVGVAANALLDEQEAETTGVAPILVSLGVVQVLYSVWVGGDAWESLLIANRYLSVAIVPVAVLAAVGVARVAREPRWFGLFCGLTAAVLGAGVLVARTSFAGGGVTNYSRSLLGAEADQQLLTYVILVVGLIVAAVVVSRGVWRPSPKVLAVAATVAIVVLTNARSTMSWSRNNAFDLEQDLARRGWVLAEATDPDTEIAVWMAGAEPYFADRSAIDLFGKSDRRIARLTVPDDVLFWPGHVKYDLEGSLDRDRPDIVVLGGSSPNGPEIREILEDHDYKPFPAGVWVLDGSDSDKIDPWKLARLLRDMQDENLGD